MQKLCEIPCHCDHSVEQAESRDKGQLFPLSTETGVTKKLSCLLKVTFAGRQYNAWGNMQGFE